MKDAQRRREESSLWEIAAWIAAMGVFAPVCLSFAYYCASFSQLSEAFLTFVFAALAVAVGYGLRPSKKPYFTGRSFASLATAYALFFAAAALKDTLWGAPLLLGGVAAALMSAGYAFFRGGGEKFVGAVGIGLYAYALLALLMPIFDMPLRYLSGMCSAEVLNAFGADAKLLFFKDAGKFLLLLGGRPFEVAAQCNGFGLMTSCAILSILLAVPDRNKSAGAKIALVLLCVFLAFIANIMRILCIVLTAGHISMQNYHAMHEAYGYLFFLAALGAVFAICRPRAPRGNPPRA